MMLSWAAAGADWERSSPEREGMDPGKVAAAVRYLEHHSARDGATQLVIVRDGRLVWEGPNSAAAHGVWSMTKSFTSSVLGLLIDDGKATLDTLARDHVPAVARSYPALRLRHFATMTSGYRAAGDEPKGTYRHGPSETPLVPAAPIFEPGSKYLYWDSAMNQFGHVLTRIAGESMSALFRRRIAEPIGMREWHWGDIGVHEGLTVNGGAGNYGMMHISAREIAKFGELFRNGGAWNGRQLIARRWVEEATRAQVTVATSQESPVAGTGVYGFNWWVNGTAPDGNRKWPGAPPGTFSASGHNNNDMFVVPEWRMVVVRLGLDQDDREVTDRDYGEFLRLLGEAIRK
jgi:CubicO group peptidase (beta-lactamase class C family)